MPPKAKPSGTPAKPPTYTCQSTTCRWPGSGTPHSKCPFCQQAVQGPQPIAAATFASTRDQVVSKLDSINAFRDTKFYCNAVMESLENITSGLRETFIANMQNPQYLTTFVTNPRANDAQKRCVDNALSRGSGVQSRGYPMGEKFEWEMPYIMTTAGWLLFTGNTYAFEDMPTVLGRCADALGGTQFMFLAMPRGKTDGHAILITKFSNALWVTDPQRAPNQYNLNHNCIAWRRPSQVSNAGDIYTPRRAIAPSGEWENPQSLWSDEIAAGPAENRVSPSAASSHGSSNGPRRGVKTPRGKTKGKG